MRCFFISGVTVLVNSSVLDCILFVACGNYTTDFISDSTTWEVPFVHYDSGNFIHLDNRLRSQRTLPVINYELIFTSY